MLFQKFAQHRLKAMRFGGSFLDRTCVEKLSDSRSNAQGSLCRDIIITTAFGGIKSAQQLIDFIFRA